MKILTPLFLVLSLTIIAQNHSLNIEIERKIDIADSLSNLEKYSEAVDYYDSPAAFFRSNENWEKYVEILVKRAKCHLKLNNIADAEIDIQEAIKLGESHLESESELPADAYHLLAVKYMEQRKLDLALDPIKKALDMRINLLGDRHYKVAESFNVMASIFIYSGKFQKALESSQKGIQSLSQDTTNTSTLIPLFNVTAIAYLQLGDLETSIKYFTSAKDLAIKEYGENSRSVSTYIHNMGILYSRLGDMEKSLEARLKALEITENVFPPNHPAQAASLANVGNAYLQNRDYRRAYDYHKRALDIQILSNPKSDLVALQYSNLGEIEHKQKNYTKAERLLLKSLELHQNLPDREDNVHLAKTLEGLGNLNNEKGEYSKAIKYFKWNKEIQSRMRGENNFFVANANIGIARAYLHIDRDLAIKHVAMAEAISKEVPSSKVRIYRSIAFLNLELNKPIPALNFIQESIINNVKDFASTDIYTNPKLENWIDDITLLESLIIKVKALEVLYREIGELKILEFSNETLKLCDRLITILQSDLQYQDNLIPLTNSFNTYYELGIRINMELATVKNDDSYLEQSFYYAEKSKAVALRIGLNTNKALASAGIPGELVRLEKSLKDQQTNLITKIQEAKENENDSSQVYLTKLENEKFEINRSLDSINVVLQTQFPKFYKQKYNATQISTANLQSQLDNNQAFIEYFEGDSTIYCFNITKSDFLITEIEKDENLNNHLDFFIESLHAKTAIKDTEQYFKEFTETSSFLYQSYLKENLKTLPKEVNRLIIVPSGKMALIPWGILLINPANEDSKIDYRNLEYVFKKYAISYQYAADLLNENELMKKASSNQLLAVAPSYMHNSQKKTSSNSLSVNRDRLEPLLYTSTEVEKIAEIMSSEILMGADATEGKFKANASKFKILHLAMHAFVDNEMPIYSSLVFQEDSTSDEDRFLHTYELYNMNLSAELAVLSACNTGTGENSEGEGVMSLGRAFTYAGCPSVIMSHWAVKDESTSTLMKFFYEEIDNGIPKDIALQKAKLTYLEQSDNIRQYPNYWASFVIFGNTDPITKKSNFIYYILGFVILILIITLSQRGKFRQFFNQAP